MPSKCSFQPLRETKRVSTEGIYEHRSALVATSGLHNSRLLMCWNCFWRQTDWYNGVVGVLKGCAASVEAWFTDLGSIYSFALALFGVCAEAAELAWHARVLREALELFFEPSPNRKWALITSMVDFYCKQVNAIDFVSAVTCKNWCDGTLSFCLLPVAL